MNDDRPLVWRGGEVKTPPFSSKARQEAGLLLRRLQRGESLSLPHSRPMPAVGRRCHELRIHDGDLTWRILVRLDPDAIVIADVFAKKTKKTSRKDLERARSRLRDYDEATR